MYNTYPNPWDFSNIDNNLTSPNKKYKIEFGELNEITMGAPLIGQCYLIFPNNSKLKISNHCGGPIVWEPTSKKIAIPIWTDKREQKIGCVDVDDKTLTIYSKTFRVLDLKTFDQDTINGFDSPIHKTTQVEFNIANEQVEKVIQL